MVKKALKAFVACGLLGGMGLSNPANAEEIYSSDVVGVITISVMADEPQLVSVPLMPQGVTDSYFTVSEVMGTNSIPDGTEVKLYDSAARDYVIESFSGGAWSPDTNHIVNGQGFWLTSPSNHDFICVGLAPNDSRSSSLTVQLVEGLQIVGYPYPVETSTETNSFAGAVEGDMIIQVDGDGALTNQNDAASWYGSGTGWQPVKTNRIYGAYWYRSYSNREWVVSKPYTYP